MIGPLSLTVPQFACKCELVWCTAKTPDMLLQLRMYMGYTYTQVHIIIYLYMTLTMFAWKADQLSTQDEAYTNHSPVHFYTNCYFGTILASNTSQNVLLASSTFCYPYLFQEIVNLKRQNNKQCQIKQHSYVAM